MGWKPKPSEWTYDQSEKARAMVNADQWDDPSKRDKMKAALEWFDKNMVGDDPGTQNLAPEPDYDNLGAARPPAAVGGAPVGPKPRVVTVSDAQRPEKGALEQYADAMTQAADPMERTVRSINQTAVDAARGYGQGATFGMADEGASRLVPEIDDGTGIPRTYAAGSAQKDMQASMRRDNREAQKRSPIAYGASEMAAMIPTSIAATPVLPESAPLLLRGGVRAVTTGSQAMLSSMGHGNAEPGEGGADALRAGRDAVGVDALLQMATAGAGATGKAAAPLLKRGADYLRGKASGIMPVEARQLLRNEGADGITDLGAHIEREGWHLNDHGFPASAKGIHANASAAAEQSGQRIGELADWMSDVEGVAKPTASVFASLRSAVAKMPNETQAEQVARAKITEEARALESAFDGQPSMSAADIHRVKTKLQKQVYEGTTAAKRSPSPDLSDTPVGEGRQAMDRNMRGQLYDLVDDPGQRWGGASPETAAEFHSAMDQHGAARAVEKAAEKRAGHQMGYVPLGLTALAGGAAAGGASAYGGDSDAKGTAGATALGALGTIALNRYGANYGATMARTLQQGAEAVPAIASAVSRAPVGAVVGSRGEQTTTHPLPRESRDVLDEIKSNPDAYGDQTDLISQLANDGDVKQLRLALMAAAQRRN